MTRYGVAVGPLRWQLWWYRSMEVGQAPRDFNRIGFEYEGANSTSDFFKMADKNNDTALTFFEIMDARMTVLEQMDVSNCGQEPRKTKEAVVENLVFRYL